MFSGWNSDAAAASCAPVTLPFEKRYKFFNVFSHLQGVQKNIKQEQRLAVAPKF
jgi:hypothetical protein